MSDNKSRTTDEILEEERRTEREEAMRREREIREKQARLEAMSDPRITVWDLYAAHALGGMLVGSEREDPAAAACAYADRMVTYRALRKERLTQ